MIHLEGIEFCGYGARIIPEGTPMPESIEIIGVLPAENTDGQILTVESDGLVRVSFNDPSDKVAEWEICAAIAFLEETRRRMNQ